MPSKPRLDPELDGKPEVTCMEALMPRAHMYRMYGSRATQGAVAEDAQERSQAINRGALYINHRLMIAKHYEVLFG